MLLTLEKKVKENIEVTLSQPQYRKILNDTYVKFYQDGDKVKVLRHSTLGCFCLDSRRMTEHDYGALIMETGWDSITKEEFESVLQERLKKYHII